MKIAIEGCAHGEIEKIYDTIELLEERNNFKVDLLLCCGDFQSVRNNLDLECLVTPLKYREMGSFHKYYSGEKVAPMLTILIGGNHEASSYLQELPYGGWVAPNIYYLGYAGVVNVGGIRIAGISGIYKGRDYQRGRYEIVPYTEDTKRSVYHIRNLDVFRLKQIKTPIDICMSHDWPTGVVPYGNMTKLIRRKPHFEGDIRTGNLGAQPLEEVLLQLKPTYWFAAHLHVKFSALITHKDEDGNVTDITKFLALDKCLPKRSFLQILDVKHDESKNINIEYDLEWLTILHSTNHLISTDYSGNYLPVSTDDERWKFTPTEAEKESILKKMDGDLTVPLNFIPTVNCHADNQYMTPKKTKQSAQINVQTEELCQKLGLDDPVMILLERQEQGSARLLLQPSTPEGPESSFSFIDSEMSGFNSGSDENDKPSPAGERKTDFISPSEPKTRALMVLPPPKYETNLTTEEEPVSSSTPTVVDSSLYVIDDGIKRSHNDEIDLIPTTLNNKLSQGMKKFKRRNQDMYSNKEE